MKWVNLAVGILFLLFAVVQYNDPDPWLWIALYGLVAGVALAAFFGSRKRWVPLVGIAAALVWLMLLLPEFINWLQMGMPSITETMKVEDPHIEYTREFLGLAVCIIAFIFYWRGARKHRTAK